jgi:hypothetical protein
MKRLDDIPKKNIYQVPEGYFDKLPGMIQTRVAESRKTGDFHFNWSFALRYALPALVLVIAGIFWFQSSSTIEQELEQIDVEQLSFFLEDSGFTTEELAETVTWSEDDINELEDNVYSTIELSNSELDELIEELDLNM